MLVYVGEVPGREEYLSVMPGPQGASAVIPGVLRVIDAIRGVS